MRRLIGALLCVFLAGPAAAGVLDASWTDPTANTDGSALVDLAAIRVYYGPAPAAPCPGSTFLQVTAPDAPAPNTPGTAHLTGLVTGASYNVQVTAVDIVGSESACSATATAVARPDATGAPSPGTNLRIAFTPDGPPPSTVTFGEPTALTGSDCCRAGRANAMKATLATGGTLTSLSAFIAVAGGKVELAIYQDMSGRPGQKLASTGYVPAPAGWITAPVPAGVVLGAGPYWLAFSPDNNVAQLARDPTAGQADYADMSATGILMPTTFPAAFFTQTMHWSIYGTVTSP